MAKSKCKRASFPKSLYKPLIRDSEEVSIQIFSLDESHWDYSLANPSLWDKQVKEDVYNVYVLRHCYLCNEEIWPLYP